MMNPKSEKEHKSTDNEEKLDPSKLKEFYFQQRRGRLDLRTIAQVHYHTRKLYNLVIKRR